MREKFNRGLSGCSLILLSNTIIRKSCDDHYVKRLVNQAKKQQYFSNYNFTTIDVPKVVSISDNYFDMDYIPAKTFDTFFEICSTDQVHFILNSLYEYFDFLIQNKKTFKGKEFQKKVNDKILSLDIFDKNFKNFLLDYEYDFSNIPKSFCHGDLTFSNIIFHKNRLFFIDFLDCYVDTFLSDLVKIKQDLDYFWALKTWNVHTHRLEQIYRFAWNELENRYSSFMYEPFDILDVMNILRIEPYLTSEDQRVILDRIIKSTKIYANFISSNGGPI